MRHQHPNSRATSKTPERTVARIVAMARDVGRRGTTTDEAARMLNIKEGVQDVMQEDAS